MQDMAPGAGGVAGCGGLVAAGAEAGAPALVEIQASAPGNGLVSGVEGFLVASLQDAFMRGAAAGESKGGGASQLRGPGRGGGEMRSRARHG